MTTSGETIAQQTTAIPDEPPAEEELVTPPESAAPDSPPIATANTQISLDASDVPHDNIAALVQSGEAQQHLKYIGEQILLTTVQVRHSDGTEKIYVFRSYPAGDAPFEPTSISDSQKLLMFGPGGYKGTLAGLADWAYGVPQRLWFWATGPAKVQLVAGPFDASIGHKEAAQKVFDAYLKAAEAKAVVIAKAVPIVGTVLHFQDGEWLDGTISLLGDAALVAGPLAKGLSIAKYAKAADAVRKASVADGHRLNCGRSLRGCIDPAALAAD